MVKRQEGGANACRFRKVSAMDGFGLVRHMLLSTYPAGKEWDPSNEPQVYFIKSGVGRRYAVCSKLRCHVRVDS
jgi:hypothetical protein